MNTRLEEAFAQASQLPPEEQEALAAFLLDEVASERLWDWPWLNPKTRLPHWRMRP